MLASHKIGFAFFVVTFFVIISWLVRHPSRPVSCNHGSTVRVKVGTAIYTVPWDLRPTIVPNDQIKRRWCDATNTSPILAETMILQSPVPRSEWERWWPKGLTLTFTRGEPSKSRPILTEHRGAFFIARDGNSFYLSKEPLIQGAPVRLMFSRANGGEMHRGKLYGESAYTSFANSDVNIRLSFDPADPTYSPDEPDTTVESFRIVDQIITDLRKPGGPTIDSKRAD